MTYLDYTPGPLAQDNTRVVLPQQMEALDLNARMKEQEAINEYIQKKIQQTREAAIQQVKNANRTAAYPDGDITKSNCLYNACQAYGINAESNKSFAENPEAYGFQLTAYQNPNEAPDFSIGNSGDIMLYWRRPIDSFPYAHQVYYSSAWVGDNKKNTFIPKSYKRKYPFHAAVITEDADQVYVHDTNGRDLVRNRNAKEVQQQISENEAKYRTYYTFIGTPEQRLLWENEWRQQNLPKQRLGGKLNYLLY